MIAMISQAELLWNTFTEYLFDREQKNKLDDIMKLYPVDDIIHKIISTTQSSSSNNSIIYKELEFFQSNDGIQPSFFAHINNTSTLIGKQHLINQLQQPITNIVELIRRQNIITHLVQFTDIRNYIKQRLAEIASIEKYVLNIQLPPSEELEELHKNILFTGPLLQWVNHSDSLLSFYYYLVILITPVYGVISPLVMLAVQFIMLKYVFKIEMSFSGFWDLFKKIFITNSIISTVLGNIAKINLQSSTDADGVVVYPFGLSRTSYYIYLAIKYFAILATSSFGKMAYIGLLIGFYFYGIFQNTCTSVSYYRIIEKFHFKVQQMSKLVRSIYYLSSTVSNIPGFKICNEMNGFFDRPLIKELLTNDVYISPFHILVSYGRIMKTYKDILDILKSSAEYFYPVFRLVADIDSYYSMAECYATRGMCLATYHSSTSQNDKQSVEPFVNSTNMRNICCRSPVCNDIHLGNFDFEPSEMKGGSSCKNSPDTECENTTGFKTSTEIKSVGKENIAENIAENEEFEQKDNENADEADKDNTTASETNSLEDKSTAETSKDAVIKPIRKNIMIITGANGSGKSTYIKMLAHNIILAQTFGVAFADSLELTPFVHLTTYLNIPDCNGKESLFQAEMKRCHEFLGNVKKWEEQKEPSFNIIDEIFVSTNHLEGMSSAASVLKNITRYENALTILITHFDLLTKLAGDGICNQHFAADISSDGSIICDFKLKPGANTKHQAISLMKSNGFDTEIVETAKEIYKEITTNTTNTTNET